MTGVGCWRVTGDCGARRRGRSGGALRARVGECIEPRAAGGRGASVRVPEDKDVDRTLDLAVSVGVPEDKDVDRILDLAVSVGVPEDKDVRCCAVSVGVLEDRDVDLTLSTRK